MEDRAYEVAIIMKLLNMRGIKEDKQVWSFDNKIESRGSVNEELAQSLLVIKKIHRRKV